MSHLPMPLLLFFLLTTLLAVVLFYLATRGSKAALVVSLFWIALQTIVSLRDFYLNTITLPPHFILAIAPPLVLTALLFVSRTGRSFLDGMDLKWMVLLHTVRIFVEINLFLLFLNRQVPALLTFEGGNLDILSGVSAPIIWWCYQTDRIGRRGLLLWNSLCLIGVVNAVARALLSAPFRFQRFGFDQPTTAILTFPFVLLPAFIVPAVLLCHLAIFRRLADSRAEEQKA